jgi:hypothetical protein
MAWCLLKQRDKFTFAFLPNVIRVIINRKYEKDVGWFTHGEMGNNYKILVREPNQAQTQKHRCLGNWKWAWLKRKNKVLTLVILGCDSV